MKSLKEFITENLEKPTGTTPSTVQENTEKQVDENNDQKIISENINKQYEE